MAFTLMLPQEAQAHVSRRFTIEYMFDNTLCKFQEILLNLKVEIFSVIY